MQNFKINHFKSIQIITSNSIFLKLCYFSFVFLFLSCATDTNKNKNLEKDTSGTEVIENTKQSQKRIVVFGDSLTAGYGLDDTEDAFPGLLQKKIDSLGLDFEVVNSGVSGETTAGGVNRVDWILNDKPDVFILELGANDGLRGVPLSETRKNLQMIIDRVKTKYPDSRIILAGMQIPPNLGQDYTQSFKNIFPEIANKNNLELIPFLLDGVGGVKELNQSDGIHPTKEGHKILANNVWKVLSKTLKKV